MKNYYKRMISFLFLVTLVCTPLCASAFLICIPLPRGGCFFCADSFASRNEVTFINDTGKEQEIKIQYTRCGVQLEKIKRLAPNKTYTFNCLGASKKTVDMTEKVSLEKVQSGQTWHLSKDHPETPESEE